MKDAETKKYSSKVMCKKCQQETWHEILYDEEYRESDDENEIWVSTTYTLLKCRGCENICLLTQGVCSEDFDPQTGELDVDRNVYPSPFKSDRELIDKIYHVPKDISLVYGETIKAMNFGMSILTAIGIRSTIEAIAIDQHIEIWGIEAKIKEMVKLKIITPGGSKSLLLVKDVGNMATHTIKKHHHDELSLCIDIVEGVLNTLYVEPKEVEHARDIIDGKRIRVE